MLDKKKKDKIIAKYKTHPNDTGSSEVQIAILTEEIKELTKHLKSHKKDFSSRRGLIKKVSQRRKLLRYLERDNTETFDKIVKDLKINISKRRDRFEEEDLDLTISDESEEINSDKDTKTEVEKK